MTERLATTLATLLRAAGDPETAEGAKRYLKSDLEHYGVRIPEIRKLVRRTATDLTHEEIVRHTRELWDHPVHECRIAATVLLDNHVDRLRPDDLALIGDLVRDSWGWALVDPLSNTAGRVLLRHPVVLPELRRWAEDEFMWTRRSGLVAFLPALSREETFVRYFPDVGALCDPLLADDRFFVRKAIGWLLRHASRRFPDEVFKWTLPRATRCSAVTIREALRYLRPEQQAEIQRLRRDRVADGPAPQVTGGE